MEVSEIRKIRREIKERQVNRDAIKKDGCQDQSRKRYVNVRNKVTEVRTNILNVKNE